MTEITKKFQLPELDSSLTAFLMTICAGGFDTYTMLGKSQVFANAMTGNLVFGLIDLAQGEWSLVRRYFTTILCFILGSLCVKITFSYSKFSLRQSTGIILTLELLVLLLVPVIDQHWSEMISVDLIAFAAALQSGSFTIIQGIPFNSVIITANLRRIIYGMHSLIRKEDGAWPKVKPIIIVVAGFSSGVVIGAFLIPHLASNFIYLLAMINFIAFYRIMRQRKLL